MTKKGLWKRDFIFAYGSKGEKSIMVRKAWQQAARKGRWKSTSSTKTWSRESELGVEQGFKPSKPTPSASCLHHPCTSYGLHNNPKQHHYMGTKGSNTSISAEHFIENTPRHNTGSKTNRPISLKSLFCLVAISLCDKISYSLGMKEFIIAHSLLW